VPSAYKNVSTQGVERIISFIASWKNEKGKHFHQNNATLAHLKKSTTQANLGKFVTIFTYLVTLGNSILCSGQVSSIQK
jgi:hypothetical protein